MVSKARLDLPEPDRPGMTISLSRGRSMSTPLRLCSRAPLTEMWVRLMGAICSRFVRVRQGDEGASRNGAEGARGQGKDSVKHRPIGLWAGRDGRGNCIANRAGGRYD